MTVMSDLQPDPLAFRAALASETVSGILLLDLHFRSKVMRLSNWNVDATIQGEKYFGMGILSRISEIGDGSSNATPPVEYGLGIPTSLLKTEQQAKLWSLPEILGDKEEYTGRKAVLSLQVRKNNANVGVPLAMHVGLMYQPRLSISSSVIDLSIISENITVRKRTPASGYLTNSDQTARHPTDKGLEFTAQAGAEPVDWLNS